MPAPSVSAPDSASSPPDRPGPADPVKPRPRWLRALGHDDPPTPITVDNRRYRRLRIYKHDAFAATGLYAAEDDPDQRIIAKFARRQSAFGIPMAWLGRWFHAREVQVYRRLADSPLIPQLLGPVQFDGRPWPHALARVYVAGHPLGHHERPADDYFPQLQQLLELFHARRVAVVDLNKRDNLLVAPDGRPHLMDFQISLTAPAKPGESLDEPWSWTWWSPLDFRRWLFGPAARADRYHLMKHWLRHRPDQLIEAQRDLDQYRPVGVRLFRKFVRPIHIARRKLLVALRVRTGKGAAETEIAPDVRPAAPAPPTTATLPLTAHAGPPPAKP